MLWPEVPCVDLLCQGGPGAAALPVVPTWHGPSLKPQCVGLEALTTSITGIAFLMLCVYPVPVFTYLLSLMAVTTFVLVQCLAPCVDNWEQTVAWVCLIWSLSAKSFLMLFALCFSLVVWHFHSSN